MKKFTLSLATVVAMSTFAIADTGYYAGIAYGAINTDASFTDGVDTLTLELDHKTVMFQAGYQVNPYIAVEGRYWTAAGDVEATASITGVGSASEDLNDDSNVWGIYAKPMYPVTPEFTAYALLGYGNVELDIEGGASADESQFQWGLGASYAVNANVSLFVDYVAMYDDTESVQLVSGTLDGEIDVDSWNFGVTYKF